jgi:hypothetical protein
MHTLPALLCWLILSLPSFLSPSLSLSDDAPDVFDAPVAHDAHTSRITTNHFPSSSTLFPTIPLSIILTHSSSTRSGSVQSLVAQSPCATVITLYGPNYEDHAHLPRPYDAIAATVVEALDLADSVAGDASVLFLEDDCIFDPDIARLLDELDGGVSRRRRIERRLADAATDAYSLGALIVESAVEGSGDIRVTRGWASHAVIMTRKGRELLRRLMAAEQRTAHTTYDKLLYSPSMTTFTGPSPLAIQRHVATPNQGQSMSTWPPRLLAQVASKSKESIDWCWAVYAKSHDVQGGELRSFFIKLKTEKWDENDEEAVAKRTEELLGMLDL